MIVNEARHDTSARTDAGHATPRRRLAIHDRRGALLATLLAAVLVAVLASVVAPPLRAAPATCTADDFARAVDEAGAELRRFNSENAPKLNAKLRELKKKKGWSDDDEDMALDYLSDSRLTGFDSTANELLARIDTLGRPAEGKTPDCAKLDELKAAGLELVAVMKAKSSYMSGKIDAEVTAAGAPSAAPMPAGEPAKAADASPKSAESAKPAPGKPAAGQQQAALPPPAPPATPKPSPPPPSAKPPAPATTAKASPPPAAKPATAPVTTAPAPGQPKPGQPWSTTTQQQADNAPMSGGPLAPPPGTSEPQFIPPEEGYTIEEIRDATRGFFGSVSTSLATVIEHTFSSLGRPTGYVLGSEGGGAFLAGLRYGSGMLYMRSGGGRPVYWHGPSLGYDFGAAGSRTLFLIYGLHDANQLYRTYTGIDGSAYVIGGVGVTFLKGGDVTMAPIRSGLGLRVGANIGYVRFTAEPSWNPF